MSVQTDISQAQGARHRRAPCGLRRQVGRWALAHWPGATPKSLRALGLAPPSVSAACDIHLVRSPKEFQQVLSLRQLSYGLAGKVDAGASPAAREDRWDAGAQIIAAFHQGRAVGSVRVNIPTGREAHEIELLTRIPPPYDRRTSVGVMTRVCTHPNYRGSDLLEALMEAGHELIRGAGRDYAVGGCTLGLVPVYARFGWKALPCAYSQAAFGGFPEQLIVRDLKVHHPIG